MLACLAALVSMLQLLNLLDRAGSLVDRGGVLAIGRFMALRLPALVAEMIPLAVLIGATLTFLRLAANLEMTAMRASGRSLLQTWAALLPVCAVIAATQFALRTEIVPRTERLFAEWWFRTAPALAPADEPPRLWLRASGDVAAVDRVSPDGTRLDGVTVLQRSAAGDLEARLDARRADFRNGGWMLEDVRIARPDGRPMTTEPVLGWPLGPAPANMIELARPVDAMTLGRLLETLRGSWVGARGPAFYVTLLNRLAASLLDPFIMVALALPTALAPARSGGGSLLAGSGLALGLGYLVAAGLLQALGSGGWLPPVVAGWGATLMFTVLALTRIIRADES
jgi:lipopolysaccharide export system permease protein